MKALLLALVLASTLTGCSHALHQYHVSDVKPLDIKGRDYKRIFSQKEQFVILGFVRQTDYVNEAYEDLKQQCPQGWVTGINTRYSTSHGFFSWTNKIRMTGFCVI